MSNLSLNNALTGILTSQSVIDVISHNVSNASDEDYSRQKPIVKSNRPLLKDRKFFGTGVNLEEVIRQKSEFIERRLRTELQGQGEFTKLDQIMQQVETIIGEPSDEGIRGTFSELNENLQNLANDPENRGARTSVIGQATTFANAMKRINRQFQTLAGDQLGTINDQIQAGVDEINNLAQQIAEVNNDIAQSEAQGGNPNDLLDKRDSLVQEVSTLIDTDVNQSRGDFRVTVRGYTLVQGSEAHQLSFKTKGDSETPRIFYDNATESQIQPKSGELKALFDLRDDVIPGFVDRLNDLTVQYVDRFNDIHKAGFGLDGQSRNNFFAELPTRNSGVYRLEGMGDLSGSIEKQRAGYIDSPDLALIGDSSTVQAENFENDSAVFSRNAAGDQVGNPTGSLEINDTVINYDMRDDSINDIIERINTADNQAEAYLSAENRLVIKGSQANDYQLDSIEDSGLLLDKTNVLRVGGSNRTSNESVGDPTLAITNGANFGGDTRIDATVANPDGTSGREVDLAEGTLEFESFNSANFHVSYDGREDSLNDIVSRINTRANNAGSKIRAGINDQDRLEVFAYEDAQNVSTPAGPGTTTLSVANTDAFSEGQRIGFSTDNSGETTTVENVDEGAGTITVELSRNYTGSNAQVTSDFDSRFNVNDEASQQIAATVGGDADTAPDTVQVKDSSVFNVGDEVRLTQNDGSQSETVTVQSVDVGADTIQVDDLTNTYNAGLGNNDNNAAIQKSADTNRNRSLLSVMELNRQLTSNQAETEFAVEGTKRRPPLAEQVAGLRVSERVSNNPDLIAAAQGEDTDLDGIAEVSNGPGDGSNAQALSALQSQQIMNSGNQDPEEEINEFITNIGSQASLAERERSASETLVNNIQEQQQEISGVNIDQELTRMIQQQQLFQASSRIIQTVQQLNQSLLQVV